MDQLSLEFFGAFQVRLNEQPVSGFESNKARALLAYLAVESAQAHARASLAALFWPEFREESARDNLRHTLTNLRKVLHNDASQPPFLLIDRQQVQFNRQSKHQLDVAEVAHCLTLSRQYPAGQSLAEHQIGLLERATTLYRASFLDGFFLDQCSAFEEWLLLTRERLHNQMVGALDRLVEHFETSEQYAKAESYARRLLALDNLREQAYCALMRLLAVRGERTAALSQFEQCRLVLANELGVQPSTETVALHQQIQRGEWQGKPTRRQPPIPLLPSVPSQTAPPLSTSPHHNLPVPINSFVGRNREVAEIGTLLRQPTLRLLTLQGSGGVGKTRLALQSARQLLNDFPDGCTWVELAPLQNPVQVPLAIAQSLGIDVRGGDPLQHVKEHLRQRNALLVLDNYEHLLAAAPLVSELLRHAEHLKCLVTSREPLHLQGEVEYAVTPLLMPSSHQLAQATQAIHQDVAWFEAVQLFTHRAQSVKLDFLVDTSNASAVAEICLRLDGLPLAIELAAARCKFFSPQVILQKLTASALGFLQHGARDVSARHQTLRSAIEWSYDLLNEFERRLFRCLAIFVGGWTLSAVEQIGKAVFVDGIDITATLFSLVDKNLVRQAMKADEEPRFLLLETMREFALQQLSASVELPIVQKAHANYYDELATQLCEQTTGPNSQQALLQLQTEAPNIRAALQWFLAEQMAERSLVLCNTFASYWHHVGDKEAYDYFVAALKLGATQPPTPAYVNALGNAGYICFIVEERGSVRHYFEQCLKLNAAIGNQGDPVKIGTAHGLLAWSDFDEGDYQRAREHFAAAKENDLAFGGEWTHAVTLANHGKMEARIGEFEYAHQLLADALTLLHRVDDPWAISLTLQNLAWSYLLQNRIQAAADALAQSEIYFQKAPNDLMRIEINRLSALVAHHQGDYRRANQLLKAALRLRQKVGTPRYQLIALETSIQIFVGQGLFYQGLVLASTITSYRQMQHLVAPPTEKRLIDAATALSRQQLSAEIVTTAWRTGECMTLHEAICYALNEILGVLPSEERTPLGRSAAPLIH